jgi:hypothetical protein
VARLARRLPRGGDDYVAAEEFAQTISPVQLDCRVRGHIPPLDDDAVLDVEWHADGGWTEKAMCTRGCGTEIHVKTNGDGSPGGTKYKYADGYLAEPGEGHRLTSKEGRRALRLARRDLHWQQAKRATRKTRRSA